MNDIAETLAAAAETDGRAALAKRLRHVAKGFDATRDIAVSVIAGDAVGKAGEPDHEELRRNVTVGLELLGAKMGKPWSWRSAALALVTVCLCTVLGMATLRLLWRASGALL